MPSAADTAMLGEEARGASLQPARLLTRVSARWTLAALIAALVALRAVTLLYDHSLHSIDGAMQTWFALSGFASGAQLGVEFQSYLGITMILALLPAYWGFGQSLFASTLAAYAAVTAGAFASAYALVWFARVIPKDQRAWWAIIFVFALYFVGRAPFDLIGYPYPLSFEPGVSLRPLRGLLPVLALPAFVLAARAVLRTHSALPAAGLGVVAGVGLLWSNDAGIPLVIAMTAALVAVLIGRWRLMSAAFAVFLSSAFASSAVLLMLVTQGAPGGWLEYNFVSVAGDQFWYFGPWDREARVLSPIDLWRVLTLGNPLSVLSLLSLATCVIIAFVKRLLGRGSRVRTGAFILVGASLVGTALIPQIGGHIGAEYNHITFMMGLGAPLILMQRRLLRWSKSIARAIPAAAPRLIALVAAASTVFLGSLSAASTVRASERTVYNANLGFFVTPQYAADIAALDRLLSEHNPTGRSAPDRKLVSVYTSALDVGADAVSAAPVGSIIHALGQDYRWSYDALVAHRTGPPVLTIAPDYSGWEGWNIRANWPFFARLRQRYTPIARNDQHVLWMPAGSVRTASPIDCTLTPLSSSSLAVSVSGARDGMATVQIRRDAMFADADYTPPRNQMLTVTEDSPFTRAATGEPWGGFPRYGVGNTHVVIIPAPLAVGETTTLTLDIMDGSPIGQATCRAFLEPSIEPSVDTANLPSIAEGIERYLAGPAS